MRDQYVLTLIVIVSSKGSKCTCVIAKSRRSEGLKVLPLHDICAVREVSM